VKVTGAVVVVILLETFVFSPRILGRMMEVHPVLLLTLLPIAQYFFGVWGLILTTPITVYVVHVLILRRGLPGITAVHKPPGAEAHPAGAVESALPGEERSAATSAAKSETV
jgi:hypothetical protein